MADALPWTKLSDHQRVDGYKLLLGDQLLFGGQLRRIIAAEDGADGLAAIAALAELTAELSYMLFGRQLTLDLFEQLATQIAAREYPPSTE